VSAELLVDVAQVRPDRVRGQVKLLGDLRHGQTGGQVTQDAGLSLAERLAHASGPAGRCGRAGRPRQARPGEQAQDVGDEGAVGGAVPGMALEQIRLRVEEERHDQAVGLSEIQSPLKCMLGGGRVAEHTPRDRLQQKGFHLQDRSTRRGGASDSRPKRYGRRLRIVAGQAQHRSNDAHECGIALLVVHLGQGGFDAFGLAQPHEDLQRM
jgi:hypothetical protein